MIFFNIKYEYNITLKLNVFSIKIYILTCLYVNNYAAAAAADDDNNDADVADNGEFF